MSLIIFTGIDEILIPQNEPEHNLIAAEIQRWQGLNISLVPVTSKTRAEVAAVLQEFALNTPFIVEQGSAVFIPKNTVSLSTTSTVKVENYHLHQLGCSYTEARAALKAVQEEINKILRGFGGMDESQIQSLINISSIAARRAKAREFSEYFLSPNRLEAEQLEIIAAEYGFKILSGEKLSLILSAGADVAEAIKWLIQNHLPSFDRELTTIGLGSTSQDLSLLETVDIPLIIPTNNGFAPCFAGKDWQVVLETGSQNWIESVRQIIKKFL